MTSKAITPLQWLAKNPLRPGEHLYAVISSTSTAKPLAAWRKYEPQPAEPLWANTPYADWLPVMPWLLRLGNGTALSQEKMQNALNKLWRFSGEIIGKKAEILGGLVLIGIGVQILWTHFHG